MIRDRLLFSVLVLAAALGAAPNTRGSERTERTRHATITSGLDCSTCHTAAGWRTIGGAQSGAGFDHSRTGFPLTGRHSQTPCTACHQGGAKTLSRACVSCHEDAHAGRLGQACDRCHSATGWSRTNVFDRHRLTRLPLSGMHALADCTECHQKATDREFRNVPADCFACHANDYRRQDIHPLHTGVAGDPSQPPLPRNCAMCHRATGWAPALITDTTFATATLALRQAATIGPSSFVHESKFPIRSGKHRGAECTSCHVEPRVMRLLRCDGCHVHDAAQIRKQHQGAVSPSPYACLGCHPGGAAR